MKHKRAVILKLAVIVMPLLLGFGCDNDPGVVFSPESGTYKEDQSVQISAYGSDGIYCGDDFTIYYTLDGSEPTVNDYEYDGPVKISGDGTSVTIKAFTVDGSGDKSEVESASYIIKYDE